MRQYFLSVVAIASSIMISCQQTPSAPPPEVTAVGNQLMAIDASTKIGVNQIEYSKSLTELQLAIAAFASDSLKLLANVADTEANLLI